MTAAVTTGLLSQTEAIYEKYPDYLPDDDAETELNAIWGDTVNAHGVMVNSSEEKLYDKDSYRVIITIGCARGVNVFGCHFILMASGRHRQSRTSFLRQRVRREPRRSSACSIGCRNAETSRGSGCSSIGCGPVSAETFGSPAYSDPLVT